MSMYRCPRRPARFAAAFVVALSAAIFGLSFSQLRYSRVEAASIDVLMNLSDVRQTIDGFGASDAWNDNTTPLFSDSEMDLFFSQQNGIGLSFLRLSIQPNGSNSTSLSIAQRAAARGARVWAAPWSAPGSWKDNGSTLYGGHLCASAGQGSCTAEHYSDWATRLAGFATNLKASGVDLYGISVQNEPDFTAPYESMLFTDQEMVNFVKTLGPRLAALSPRPKLLVGDYADWSHIWSLGYAIQSDPVAASYTDIYAVHQYFGTSYYQSQLPGPLWQTEMSGFDGFDPGIDNAIGVAEWMNDALVNGNVNSWHYWWLRGLNEDNEGLVGHSSDVYAMTKRVFAMGNYSRFVRPGWVRLGTVGTASNMTTLAFRNPSSNEVAFVVVNHGGTATATFGVSGTFQSAFTPYQTYDDGSGSWGIGAHGNLEPRAAIAAAGSNAFTATVPHGITTFVGTASTAQTTAPPGSFSRSSPANGATGQGTGVTLAWSDASGAASYEYCIDTTNDGSCSNWSSTGAATSAFVGGLAPGTTYYWHVRASNAGGTTYAVGGAGAFWTFTTATSAPGSFTKSSPQHYSGGQSTTPLLTWAAASGATSYEYCLDSNGVCSTWISTGSSTSVSPTALQTNTTYYWTVRAVNAGGITYADGSPFSLWVFTTQLSAPGAFSKSRPVDESSGQPTFLTLSWNPANGAHSYEYCLNTSGKGECSSWINTGGATSVGVGNLALGTSYYWQVRALNGDGSTYANNASDAFWNFTTEVRTPSVTTTGASVISLRGAVLNGIVNPGGQTTATAFEYGPTAAYGATADGPTLSGTSDQAIAATVTLSCGAAFHYRARATNTSGVQYGSDQLVLMPPCPPTVSTGFAARSSTPETTLSGSVNPMGDGTSAWFEYGTSPAYGSYVSASPWPGAGTATVQVSATLGGLTCGTVYHFRLVASNSSGAVTGDNATFTACDDVAPRGGIKGDVDGDGRSDASVYRAATGEWLVLASADNARRSYLWGLQGDEPVPGDYDGDGTMDLAIYRPLTGGWWIASSRTGYHTYISYAWGLAGDVPVPADYDGDGTTDIAVYRPSTGGWWILTSSSGFRNDASHAWGLVGDLPVPADYDGDGKVDPAIYRPSTGGWWVLKSSTGFTSYAGIAWGLPGDVPVPGDYDGDGKSDVAIFRPSTGTWWVAFSTTNYKSYAGHPWGYDTDVPVPSDYDGDGKTDIAVFRPTTGEWWILTSSSNFTTHMGLILGSAADTPLNRVVTTAP